MPPDLLALGAETAATAKTRAAAVRTPSPAAGRITQTSDIAGLADMAGRGGSSRLATEARRLTRVLAQQ